jgi:uncharacterized protein YijF (DUF1287 family)
MTYFARLGLGRGVSAASSDYLPGDIVAWSLGGGIQHVGIVSDRAAVNGVPLVIHNIGAGAREEDILFRFAIIGHYRPRPPANAAAAPDAGHRRLSRSDSRYALRTR